MHQTPEENKMSTFVTAFRGRRDGYQIPWALAEAVCLQTCINDVYLPHCVAKLHPRLAVRAVEGLSFSQVSLPPTLLWAELRLRWSRLLTGQQRAHWESLDSHYSKLAAECARKYRSNLLLYHPYAYEAFTASYSHNPHRCVFAFDPWTAALESHKKTKNWLKPLSRQILESLDPLPNWEKREPRYEIIPHCDQILCASSFVRESLIAAGANPKIITVIPYGIDLPFPSKRDSEPATPSPLPARPPRCLFVGSATLRKGLGHLLAAWERARLPASSELWIATRSSPRRVEEAVRGLSHVKIFTHPNNETLSTLYTQTDWFVMPSLCEGFGQVYLEALSHGTPILGTHYSGLPDLGAEADGIFTVQPGCVESLIHALETHLPNIAGNRELRNHSLRCAERHPWRRFRSELRAALKIET